MIILVGIFLIFVLGFIFGLSEEYTTLWGFSFVMYFFGGMFLLVFLVYYIGNRISAKKRIIEFLNTKRWINYSKENPNEPDYLTKITIDNALDENSWLFDAQYWAGHPLTKIFWPREILDLEPIDFEGLEYKPSLEIEKMNKEDRN